jgi:hypothetical protein
MRNSTKRASPDYPDSAQKLQPDLDKAPFASLVESRLLGNSTMPPRRLLGTFFFCERCQKETKFMPIHFAIEEIGVSRTTMYYWMRRDLVHWLELPSGRPMICRQSLMQQPHKTESALPTSEGKPDKKSSKNT